MRQETEEIIYACASLVMCLRRKSLFVPGMKLQFGMKFIEWKSEAREIFFITTGGHSSKEGIY